MIEGIPKISVLIITYKQEELIKRAINSLLAQKDYIYEICVSDDCSPDNTWGVLQEYDKQYPGLFKLHRNKPNVGIFENIEYTWTMPAGDLVYHLSGDDECGVNWFKTIIDYIHDNSIDYRKDLFCVYGDYSCIYPDGRIRIFQNKTVVSGLDSISLSMRWHISNRSCCYSINILKKFIKVSSGRSYVAETAQDRQLQLFSEANYYFPKIGNQYYTSIGISTKLVNKERVLERANRMLYLSDFLEKQGYILSEKDKSFCKYVRFSEMLKINNSLLNRFKCALMLLRSYNYRYDNALSTLKVVIHIFID